MSDAGRSPEFRPLPRPGHATRLALIRAYRDGLRTSPARAWEDALTLARECFPGAGTPALRKMPLLCLGLFRSDGRGRPDADEPPNTEGHMPCLVCPEVGLRLGIAARHYDLTIDELVSRVIDAWLTAACDFDGVPEHGTPMPPPPSPRP